MTTELNQSIVSACIYIYSLADNYPLSNASWTISALTFFAKIKLDEVNAGNWYQTTNRRAAFIISILQTSIVASHSVAFFWGDFNGVRGKKRQRNVMWPDPYADFKVWERELIPNWASGDPGLRFPSLNRHGHCSKLSTKFLPRRKWADGVVAGRNIFWGLWRYRDNAGSWDKWCVFFRTGAPFLFPDLNALVLGRKKRWGNTVEWF